MDLGMIYFKCIYKKNIYIFGMVIPFCWIWHHNLWTYTMINGTILDNTVHYAIFWCFGQVPQ